MLRVGIVVRKQLKLPIGCVNSILGGSRYQVSNANSSTSATTTTTTPTSWIDESKVIPSSVKPYLHLARVDKQVGTMLLLWPCIWGVALASPQYSIPSIALIGKFAIGAFVMRGAGCTINDIWDRDFDKHVERTKNRPIANGTISVPNALKFLSLQLACGLGVLVTFNTDTIILGMASMPLVVAYPLMKRFMNWPQLVLGLAFNWGALVGWSATAGLLTYDALQNVLPLYISGVCWTLVYDTLYGYQDRIDDRKLGLKSTSLYLGDKPQVPLTIIGTGMISSLMLSGYMSNLSYPFYVGAGLAGGSLLWQIYTADLADKSNLWMRFSSNQYTGGLIAASIIAGRMI